ncbi:hypothetical protein MHL31_12085 [Lutibacter sp. A80]|uniref:hypothetical protein n=1 Tax=Lutibacter sp. A80 TaxID=2918453 RepID=UPI001F0654E2|nr:hypothetical protein [Lutibacter sp. A80]UMB59813.1 hypothetical protein MHL31_12085 [Lutibacter sp. A80]
MKNLLKVGLFFLSIISIVNCSNNEDSIDLVDDRSFITDSTSDFFINYDGTVNITVTGVFTDSGIAGEVKRRGFVYGNTPNTIVSLDNTEPLLGNNPIYTTFENLEAGKTFYVRGFFEMNDDTFFYGNEIQVSTNVNATSTRSISMLIKSELFFSNSEGITPELEVTSIEKESPVAIGFEYSVNQDFSDSSIILDKDRLGNIYLTTYSEFVEGLASNTVYYFRPYAKYADGSKTNGGTSIASFTR